MERFPRRSHVGMTVHALKSVAAASRDSSQKHHFLFSYHTLALFTMLFFLFVVVAAICAGTNAFRLPTRGLMIRSSSLFRVQYSNDDKTKKSPSNPSPPEIFTQEKAMQILHELYDNAKQAYDSPEAQKALEMAKQNLEKGAKIAFDRSVEDIPKAIEKGKEIASTPEAKSYREQVWRQLSVAAKSGEKFAKEEFQKKFGEIDHPSAKKTSDNKKEGEENPWFERWG